MTWLSTRQATNHYKIIQRKKEKRKNLKFKKPYNWCTTSRLFDNPQPIILNLPFCIPNDYCLFFDFDIDNLCDSPKIQKNNLPGGY